MHIFPFSRMPVLLAFAAMVATCLLLAASVSGSAQTRPALKVAEHPKLGPYLTTGGDTSVYLFEEDRPDGERGRPVESDCVDTCLERWPPVPGEPHPEAGEGADADSHRFLPTARWKGPGHVQRLAALHLRR